ncbi:hypothetical protein BMT55_13835 [Listeria newyorkensis]|uniref:Uncharacterized protein n=1 Tax=Listeria newyorkensis TaxID=1497681 RepID=A0ABX4XKN5_9LIST|nr:MULTISPECIES: hypothetical protein [Listeria]KGL44997.1 hypothetical protein EP56_05400 [Listeriaceae bacterium FSL A5-0209]KGL40877.1 hypothetical protein EP58_11105 [Listeria newyorkensis]KMT62596.1 hypothetical protein X559_1030 [Listeria newyorkensis]PNP89133.1 hypothetical protein BMT55_13835 [Listeria newyorkensis]RQW68300.1 hypothetical protein DUK53_02710 [Listeria sp. SHR_NRA_18]
MSRFVYPYRKLVIQYRQVKYLQRSGSQNTERYREQVQVLRKLLLHPSKLLTVNKQDRDEDWLNKYINHLNMLVQNDALYKVAKEELTV